VVGQIADYGIGGFSRAELGRATWKYFHTVMARFPEKPTEDQKEALRSYIYLFARLYPWY
jgi:FAD-linked sulfhydryl oxidase